jgi:hypothetical protein
MLKPKSDPKLVRLAASALLSVIDANSTIEPCNIGGKKPDCMVWRMGDGDRYHIRNVVDLARVLGGLAEKYDTRDHQEEYHRHCADAARARYDARRMYCRLMHGPECDGNGADEVEL